MMNEAQKPTEPAATAVWENLRRVVDPELHCNMVDLGLVYGVEMREGTARLTVTLTSPGCPYGPWLLHEMREAAAAASGVTAVELDVVWDPPWSPARMTEEARLELGFDV